MVIKCQQKGHDTQKHVLFDVQAVYPWNLNALASDGLQKQNFDALAPSRARLPQCEMFNAGC